MIRVDCLRAGCPHPALPGRGRCAEHAKTTARGYGAGWRRRRGDPAGQRCEACGATGSLHRDHIVPRSIGGDDRDSNLRWLCASCHARYGVRSNANRAATGPRGAPPSRRRGPARR